ncbi:hypothetical protein SS50377_21496 [Spironucleus salmonicida]|uniref:Uncharacterized protein n=1 Tax=Spironucleus salmonicida TaxID=348837 RepID=V6LLE7_9EUKA|nr:hypothetical protein SS50377_21496 [Spironucleus salmonicida]|eukprot:EST45475.1 Hypothetical protein SS50377_14545 [Spironucleus salmonicida]
MNQVAKEINVRIKLLDQQLINIRRFKQKPILKQTQPPKATVSQFSSNQLARLPKTQSQTRILSQRFATTERPFLEELKKLEKQW